jgi:hypothetical protein
MDAHYRHRVFRFEWAVNFAAHQRNGFVSRAGAAKTMNREAAVAGREFGVRDFLHNISRGALSC